MTCPVRPAPYRCPCCLEPAYWPLTRLYSNARVREPDLAFLICDACFVEYESPLAPQHVKRGAA